MQNDFLFWITTLKDLAQDKLDKEGFDDFRKFLVNRVLNSDFKNYYWNHGPNSYRIGVALAYIDGELVLLTGRRGGGFEKYHEGESFYIEIPRIMWSVNFNRSFL